MSITIELDEDYLLDALMDIVEKWTDDEDTRELYRSMYQNYIDGGCFEGSSVDINQIVDNDYINLCSVKCSGDEKYSEIDKWYKENGCGDCSCDIDGISYIEAEHNGQYLIRY